MFSAPTKQLLPTMTPVIDRIIAIDIAGFPG